MGVPVVLWIFFKASYYIKMGFLDIKYIIEYDLIQFLFRWYKKMEFYTNDLEKCSVFGIDEKELEAFHR